MRLDGRSFGIVGALAAFPLRLAAREVEARGGSLRRGAGRGITDLVLGRRLLAARPSALAARLAWLADRRLTSEAGFLRLLGLLPPTPEIGLGRKEFRDRSGLAADDLDWLARFDAFEAAEPPFTFRDLILARKYAGLIAGGADWLSIARSVHRFGPVASLTAKALHVERCGTIYARGGAGLSELDGQLLLDLGGREGAAELDALFDEAEAAEAAGDPAEAARLYGRCLEADPRDAVAAFNRANCLRTLGAVDAAVEHYLRAAKLDAGLVEAWFNLGCLLAEQGRRDAARRALTQAVTRDPAYADAIYNLASLEFEAGNLAAAREGWLRYLALDPDSDWGRTAARGVRFVELKLRDRAG
jgi:tetratricopeptide (TPR) repeat protein